MDNLQLFMSNLYTNKIYLLLRIAPLRLLL